MNSVSKFVNYLSYNVKQIMVFVAFFSLVGTSLLIFSSASVNTVDKEAESGVLQNPAAIVPDSGASGGYAVIFLPKTTPPPTGTPNLGIFPGPGSDEITKWKLFDTWVGGGMKHATINLSYHVKTNGSLEMGSNSWGHFVRPANLGGNWCQTDVRNVTLGITVPLAFGEGGETPEQTTVLLNQVINGEKDANYKKVAAEMAACNPSRMYLRIGHEPNIEWYPWSALGNGNEARFIQAFRHVATLFKTYPGMADVKIDWNPTEAAFAEVNPGTAYYPGDAFVDVIGMDNYDRVPRTMETHRTAYKNLINFATARKKKWSLPEWGLYASYKVLNAAGTEGNSVGYGDHVEYVDLVFDNVRDHASSFAYGGYFDGHKPSRLDLESQNSTVCNADGTGCEYPKSRVQFKKRMNLLLKP